MTTGPPGKHGTPDDWDDAFIISRTSVWEKGSFPIASDEVMFCDFLVEHIS